MARKQTQLTGTANAAEAAKAGRGVAQKDKVAAPSTLTDAQAIGRTIADRMAAHMDGGDRGIYAEFMALSKCDIEAKKSALGELNAIKANRIEAAEDEYERPFADKKIASIRASFSRLTVVIEAMLSNVYEYDWTVCESFADMLAMVRLNKKANNPSERKTQPLNAKQFEDLTSKFGRIVNVKKYDKNDDTSVAQVARLEQFIVKAINAYASVSQKIPGLRFDADALAAIVAPRVVAKKQSVAHKHMRRAA